VAAATALARTGDPRGADLLAAQAAKLPAIRPVTGNPDPMDKFASGQAARALIELGDPRGPALEAAREQRQRRSARRERGSRLLSEIIQAIPVTVVGFLLGDILAHHPGTPHGWLRWTAISVNSLVILYVLLATPDSIARLLRKRVKMTVRGPGPGSTALRMLVVLPAVTVLSLRLAQHSPLLPASVGPALWNLLLWRIG
jgi:hypothetical protein